ncbi:MAG: alpha-glucan family phosphorylase [Methanotrichaceae archaeon]|nr:alpha-glucan family phosphorylase [Methanotrichaceae archaeon]
MVEVGINYGLPPELSGLADLAMNLWWSWHPAVIKLFQKIGHLEWEESGHNPIKLLRDLPKEVLESIAEDSYFLRDYQAALSRFNEAMETKVGWFTENVEVSGSLPIAYFSAEYGLHHCLPFYAGGLGFLAGDYLKECNDLAVPLVAIGFMYPEGYLLQRIRSDGWQENVDERLDRDVAPIKRVLNEDGKQLIIKVPFIDPPVHIAIWKTAVGHIPLYLLDTDIDGNDPWNRGISAHLYVGDIEQRLRQEIVLGIGGSEVLETLGIEHSVMHLNEGHPAFALLERIRKKVQDGISYEEAARRVRATSVFTTHTPVPAGHDVFPVYLMDKYFSNYYPTLGLNRDAFHQLGYNPVDPNSGFNMTALALRMSGYHNGVSRKHGEIAHQMWQSLWPTQGKNKTQINYITNGVHVPTWIEPTLELLFNKYLGTEWLADHDNPAIWALIEDIPDQELWQIHQHLKSELIDYIRERARKRWFEDRVDSANLIAGGTLLNPSALTIGFARRFAPYKRADLIFYDQERLKRLLNNSRKPLQIIFAGKAHPADDYGKRILQKVFNFAHDPNMGGRIAFIEDYGELLAQYMVHGVDLWLNNPLPPNEACGTSGMKASLNGISLAALLAGSAAIHFTSRTDASAATALFSTSALAIITALLAGSAA